MSTRLFRGEHAVAGIAPGNRGLAYGDGLFETVRVHRGALPLWPRHRARLREGAGRLGIALPDGAFLEAQLAGLADGCEAGVLKLVITRGEGGRGYAPAPDAAPSWMMALHPLPHSPADGLRLQWSTLRLASQPALAGLKHCNRLEQVLARAEAEQAGCDDALLRDMQGHPVSATSANLLVWRENRWLTPPVDHCGVAGVLRGWLLEQRLVEVAGITPEVLEGAEALALCNAVRGILPVRATGARAWPPHPAVAELRERLTMAYPMFSNLAGPA